MSIVKKKEKSGFYTPKLLIEMSVLRKDGYVKHYTVKAFNDFLKEEYAPDILAQEITRTIKDFLKEAK